MDRDWMRQQLEAFIDLAARYEVTKRPGGYIGDKDLYAQLHRAEPTVKQILRLLDPELFDKVDIDQMAGVARARNEVQRGLGILADMDDNSSGAGCADPARRPIALLDLGAGRSVVGRGGSAGCRSRCCPDREPPPPAEAESPHSTAKHQRKLAHGIDAEVRTAPRGGRGQECP